MTGPFMIVETEASIHDCAVVMRRRADVSAYEYDIVLSVPGSERPHSIGCDASTVTIRPTMTKKKEKKKKCNVFVLKRA